MNQCYPLRSSFPSFFHLVPSCSLPATSKRRTICSAEPLFYCNTNSVLQPASLLVCKFPSSSPLQSPMEGLKVSEASIIVYVHPCKSNEVSKTVLRELSTMLFSYDEVFDGVVLAYDVSSFDKCAKILPGIQPYFGVNLKVNLLLFSPKPDMLLEGKVVKLSHESIHVVVLGFSSAVITEKDIRAEFVYKMKHGQEVYASTSHKRHVIKVGTTIKFLVKSFDEEMLHVYGSLVPDNTGSIHWLDKNLEVVSHSDRSTKKREIEGHPLMSDKDALDVEPSTVDTAQKLKKSKKQKVKEES